MKKRLASEKGDEMRKEATVGNLEATNSRKEQRIPEKSDSIRKKATPGGPMTRNKSRTVYRDSIDGRFITKRVAQKRPATTEKQTVRAKPSTTNPLAKGQQS